MRAKTRRMKTKLFVLLFAIVLVAGAAVSGSIAWLVDETSSVNSVFMVGDVNVKLGENEPLPVSTFSLYGETSDGTEPIRIVPGWTVTVDDPPVTVLADSEDCYLFVKIEEDIGSLPATATFKEYLDYDAADGWAQGNGITIPTDVYYREVYRSIDPQVYDIIKNHEVRVSGSINKSMMDTLQEFNATLPSLTYTVYAVQMHSSNTTTFSPEEAWKIIMDETGTM